jgi:ankyrin repeat protein
MRPLFWLTIPDRMLVSYIATYSGDQSSFAFWEMKRLLEWGANPNYVSRGDSHLARAASRPYAEVAALLLQHGAEKGAVNARGATALDIACFYDLPEMAAFLRTEGVPFTGIYQQTSDRRPLPSPCN